MQFSTIASILAMATVAIAAPAPADIEARTGGGNTPVCSTQSQQVCCNGLLACVVQVLGGNCGGNSYCCETNAPAGALINVVALNCLKVL